MHYSIRIYSAVLALVYMGTFASAKDASGNAHPPLPSNLQSVELNRIADAIELSAQISRIESVLPEKDVVWVKVSVDQTGKATSLKSVFWTVKDLWLEDVAEVVTVLSIENASEQTENAKGSWFYQPVVFALSEDDHSESRDERRPRRNRASIKPAVNVTVASIPIHFEETELLKHLKKKHSGSTVTLFAQVGRDGKVVDARVFRFSGKKSLKKRALKTASMNKFTPLFINGKAQGVWVSYEIDLHIIDDTLRSTTIFEPLIDRSSERDQMLPMDKFVPVEIMPEMIVVRSPVYPASAKNSKISGRVWIKVLVGKDGRVKNATVARTSGNSLLDDAALSVAHQNLFTPGIQRGEPVVVWVTYKVDFNLD